MNILKMLKNSLYNRTFWILIALYAVCTSAAYSGELQSFFYNVSADSTGNVLLVDKARQTLLVLTSNDPGTIQVLDTFRITTGKVDGEKAKEGDQKTPEGIYDIINSIPESQLTDKYGPIAFVLNYPNLIDKIKNHNGSNIWIHGRDEEIVDRQTEGCISLGNGNLMELSNFIQLQNTPVIIFDSLYHNGDSPYHQKFPVTDSLFQNWLSSWEKGNMERYAQYYSPHFRSQSRSNLSNHISTKKQIEHLYNWKKVTAGQIWILQSDHETHISFQQEYLCPKFFSRGNKKLILLWSDSTWKIVSETFSSSEPRIFAKSAIQKFLKSWVDSWEMANIEQFISYYDSSFSASEYNTLEDWRRYKKSVFSRTKQIDVQISNIQITSPAEYRWSVSFRQNYWSENYRDRGIKTLLITGHLKDPATFKILSETWAASE
ncbi:MAG: L,D-transpeptidase family protein [Candidatus Marinimicrobia bacterium]|nr:L,D-transpeptidase family protein [Candidatus Neomarinimicrobiota bacterium]